MPRNIQPSQRGTTKKSIEKLTARQQIWLHEIMADPDFNATQAARKAGYRSPSMAGHSLLKKPMVQRALGKLLRERIERTQVTVDRVITELACIALFDPADMFDDDGDMLPIVDMPESARRAIAGFKVKAEEDDDGCTTTIVDMRLNAKNDALKTLAQHLGMLNDKLNVQHEVGDNMLVALLEKMRDRPKLGVVDAGYIDAAATAPKKEE